MLKAGKREGQTATSV